MEDEGQGAAGTKASEGEDCNLTQSCSPARVPGCFLKAQSFFFFGASQQGRGKGLGGKEGKRRRCGL